MPLLRESSGTGREAGHGRVWLGTWVGLGTAALFLVFRLSFEGRPSATPFLLAPIPILIASWVGGLPAGAVTTLAISLTTRYFFLKPSHSFTLPSESLYPLLVFNLQGLCIAALGAARLRSYRAWQGARTDLELRVVRRTAALERMTEQLRAEVEQKRQALQSVEQLNARLTRSNEDLQQFASLASHDLQEPLRKIRAFGNLLLTRHAAELGPQGLDYLDRMTGAAERMSRLIHDLLEFSRLARAVQRFEPVDLAAVARESLADLEVAMERSAAQVTVGPLPTLEADPGQMRLLFQNLLGNSLKFVRPGEAPEVHLESEIDTAAEVARIRFADRGIGFDSKYAERIFEMFERLHGRDDYEGTGMGLAICRRIAERHGGTIAAEGQLGGGAVFTVTLPLHHLPPPAVDAGASEE